LAYSNLAYKYDNLSRIEDEDAQIREEKKREAKKIKLRSQRRLNFFVICAVVALSMAAYFMISKNVQVHETKDQITKLENELAMLESNTSQKIFELEQSVDLNAVEQIATTRLNMQRPEKYQIVYINVQTDDVTEVTANNVEGVKNQVGNMAENMKKNFLGIFDLGLE
jgi:cell division protein FtsL